MATGAARRGNRDRDQDLIARRRSEILGAAATAFARHGYSIADVQMIADDVGVAKGTLYHYFGSKEHIFLAAVDEGMRELNARLTRIYARASDPLQAIAAVIYGYLHFFDSNKAIVELFIQERAHFAHRKRPTYFEYRDANIGPWRELVGRLIQEGRLRAESIDQVVDSLGALLYGSLFTSYFARRKQSIASRAADLIGVVFHGILNSHDSQRWTPAKTKHALAAARREVQAIVRESRSRPVAE